MPAITSSQNPTVKLIRRLAEKKYRQETGLFVAEGWDMLILRRNVMMGLPCGSEKFITKIDKMADRDFHHKPLGRPRAQKDDKRA